MKVDSPFSWHLPAQLSAWLVMLVLPFIYFFSENHAILTIELAGAASGLIFGLLIITGRLGCGSRFRVFTALLLTWLFLAGRSIFVSVDASTSWPVFIKMAALGMTCLFIASALAMSRNYQVFYRAAAWAGIIHGIIAVHEYIEAPPIPSTWLDPSARSLFRTRCAGIFTDPNIFAAFLAAIFLLTIGLMLTSGKRSERVLACVSLVLEGFALLSTLSRGGWIGLAAGAALLFFMKFKNGSSIEPGSRWALIAVGVVLTIIFIAGPFKMRLVSISNPADMTFAQRTLINRGIFRSISRFPIAGHGLHTFNQVYPRYRIVGGDYPMNAHNELIHSMIETGFLSAFILGASALLLIISVIKIPPGAFPHSGVFAAVFFSLLVQNMSGFSSRILPTAALIPLAVGAMMSFFARPCRAKAVSRSRKTISLIFFLAAVLITTEGLHSFTVQQKIQIAGDFLREGRFEMANAELEAVEQLAPENPSIYSMLGTAFFHAGDHGRAEQMWQKAATLNPGEAIFFINLARLAAKTDAIEAENFYQQALLLDPASENYRLEFARFLMAQKRNSEALAQLIAGLSFSPGFHDVYTGFKNIETLRDQLLHLLR
ncbi:MAG: O-antigen ligase family protein [Candidatus Riflebacteria bacterium]|nr:O-antigen ligase family protein [Candidatus Riflebacteria bacterium]